MTCAAYKYNLRRMQPSVWETAMRSLFRLLQQKMSFYIRCIHVQLRMLLCPHWIHIKFTNRSLCIVYLRCLRKPTDGKQRALLRKQTHEHVNLTMSSQSKLCFGEDSSKQTWLNVIIVQYVAWIHLHAIYMKIRACTWKAQTVHHHSS